MSTESAAAFTSGKAVQVCEECGDSYELSSPTIECASCGGLLAVQHVRSADSSSLLDSFERQHESGVWRYHRLVYPQAYSERVSHPEGNTPLLSRARLTEWSGVRSLQIKHEGHNPTGSFKDRGMTVAITQAKRIGAPAVACASTGNTSASLASYAAHANLPALVFVPEGQVALGKLTQTLAYGARTLVVKGDFDTCLELARDCARELGVYLVNSVNAFRIEGQKTIVFELLQQLDWQVPDVIALPAGNLGNVSAFGKALRELREIGIISRMPRLVAVQAAGAAPFAQSFREHFAVRHRVRAETIATAIRIGDPASYRRAVRAIEETNGIVTSVSDDEIIEAKLEIDASGVGCEPASAASIAGVRQLVASGALRRDTHVVAVLTGHILKDPGILVQLHQQDGRSTSNSPISIEASVAEVDKVIRSNIQ